MKQNYPTVSRHSRAISSRRELEAFMVESYQSTQVQFSAMTEHRLYANKMIGWWDQKTGQGEIFHDIFESKTPKKTIVVPIEKPATERTMTEGGRPPPFAKKDESIPPKKKKVMEEEEENEEEEDEEELEEASRLQTIECLHSLEEGRADYRLLLELI